MTGSYAEEFEVKMGEQNLEYMIEIRNPERQNSQHNVVDKMLN